MSTSGSETTFEIVGRLGAGGMADVHLAVMRRGTSTERVALKRIRSELSSDISHQTQFEREARICSFLHHENIVALRDFGEDEQGPYLALELIDGAPASA